MWSISDSMMPTLPWLYPSSQQACKEARHGKPIIVAISPFFCCWDACGRLFFPDPHFIRYAHWQSIETIINWVFQPPLIWLYYGAIIRGRQFIKVVQSINMERLQKNFGTAFCKGWYPQKKYCFFGFCLNVPSPPLSPPRQFGQHVQLFLNVKNVNLSDIKNDSLSKILLK